MINKKKKVLITTSTFGQFSEALRKLRSNDLKAIPNIYKRKVTEDELFNLLKAEKPAGLIAGTEQINAHTLREARGYLKVISRVGVGWDNIDHEAAASMGIKIYRTADAVTQAVAELALGLILDLLRKISCTDRNLRMRSWNKLMGNLLAGKKVGVIGFGRIGRRLTRLLKPFRVEIAYYDLSGKIKNSGVKSMSLERLLGWADIVTLHVSEKPNAPAILNEKRLHLMKKGSWLINTSRGSVIDEKALYRALKSGRLAGAALDVFAQEPYAGKLSSLDNVVLTPHIGSYASEARAQMEMEAVDNLLKGFK